MTVGAWMGDSLSGTSAIGTSRLDAEKSLGTNDLTSASACSASLRAIARFGSRSFAGSAGIMLANFYFFFSPKNCLFKSYGDI
jgi:hypothetical protein